MKNFKKLSFISLLSAMLFGFGSMGLGVVPDGGGGGSTDENKGTPEGAPGENKPEGEKKPEGDKKPTDAEAQLLKEVMQKKEALRAKEAALTEAQERLKQFDGIDPEAVRKLLDAQKEAELKQLESKGEWDRLKQRMAEEHAAQTQTLQEQITTLQSQLGQKAGVIDELSIGAKFTQSQFIATEMVMPPSKVRAVYGAHFDLVDGAVVGYDKPRGEPNRTALVDQSGEPVNFETAMRKIIEADPDKDSLIKSKIRQGAGSETSKTIQKTTPVESDSVSKISAGLKGFNLSPNAGIA